MIENTPEDRREIAVEVNGNKSKSGKTTYPQWINSEDELIAQYKEYCRREYVSRFADTDVSTEQLDNVAELYADLRSKGFVHDLPALTFLFKKYLTQR